MPLKDVLAPHQPVLKFLCVKLVVFFMFWQETLLSFFPTFGVSRSLHSLAVESAADMFACR